ncbi:DUF3291 domain-containing protein [Streptomyces cinerochromogenes]|uniref:DUF3291 domain-containing protein n=1 Tax=Streptomyces cinerochromogenes TaxID=66422 RepID=UPI0033AAD505
MPTLPWTAPHTPPPGTEVHVFASRFRTRTLWGALRFLARTPAVWRQVGRAPGAYGATLRAQPLRRTFWTLPAGYVSRRTASSQRTGRACALSPGRTPGRRRRARAVTEGVTSAGARGCPRGLVVLGACRYFTTPPLPR